MTNKVKGRTFSQRLSNAFGGKWKYDSVSRWFCDDGSRHVGRTCHVSDDEYAPARYVLYYGNAKDLPHDVTSLKRYGYHNDDKKW